MNTEDSTTCPLVSMSTPHTESGTILWDTEREVRNLTVTAGSWSLEDTLMEYINPTYIVIIAANHLAKRDLLTEAIGGLIGIQRLAGQIRHGHVNLWCG